MFSTGFSSGARDGRKIGVMFLGMSRLPVVCHPARSMSRTACALSDMAGYLVEMKLHGFGVDLRQGERRAYSARWTEGAEEVAAFIALVGGLSRA
jgi:hypothetical protein